MLFLFSIYFVHINIITGYLKWLSVLNSMELKESVILLIKIYGFPFVSATVRISEL